MSGGASDIVEITTGSLLHRLVRFLFPRATRFDRYAEEARKTMFFARLAVSELGGSSITPEHLALGLLRANPEAVRRFLPEASSLEAIRDRLEQGLRGGRHLPTSAEVPFAGPVIQILRLAVDEASGSANGQVHPEHILLAVLRASDGAAHALRTHGVRVEDVRSYLQGSAGKG